MKIKKLNKKGQGLPLNTIVIAILVIIVLLVIIVFFTSKIGESGKTLDGVNNDYTSNCDKNTNPLLASYKNDENIFVVSTDDKGKCNSGSNKVIGLNCCTVSN